MIYDNFDEMMCDYENAIDEWIRIAKENGDEFVDDEEARYCAQNAMLLSDNPEKYYGLL